MEREKKPDPTPGSALEVVAASVAQGVHFGGGGGAAPVAAAGGSGQLNGRGNEEEHVRLQGVQGELAVDSAAGARAHEAAAHNPSRGGDAGGGMESSTNTNIFAAMFSAEEDAPVAEEKG